MTEFKEHANVKIGSERNFGIVFTIAFAVIAAFPLIHGGAIRLWAISVSGVFLIATLLFPMVLRPLNRLWFKFGMLLGRIIAPIIMSFIFLIAVTPTALILRLFGKDPMNRKLSPTAVSYWRHRDETNDPMGSMKNQF